MHTPATALRPPQRVQGVRKQLIRYKDMPVIDPETGCTEPLAAPIKVRSVRGRKGAGG